MPDVGLLIGTASWADKPLIESGKFYPSEAKSAEARLRFYAGQVPLVEADTTYYGLPAQKMTRLWVERTPPGFLFDVKAYSLFTEHLSPVQRLPKEIQRRLPPALAGSVRTQGSLASARRIRGMVRGRGWRVPTGHPRPRRSGRGAPRSAPGGSAAGPVGGGSTSGPAPRAPIARTRPTACGSPCAGVSAIRSASGTSSSSCSSEATQSRTSRSGTGSAAAPRCSRIGCERSAAATPAAPGTWTRPPCKSPGAGALAIAPSTARGCSSTPCSARTGTSMLPGASCGAWLTWPSASRRASRLMPIRPTGGRSAGSWGARCDPDASNPGTTASSRTSGPSRSALARCSASGASRLLCGAVPRSLRADRTAASVNDGVRRSRWPSSDGSSQRAGGP